MPRARTNQLVVFYVGTHRLTGILVERAGDSPRILRFADVCGGDGFQKAGVLHLDKALATVEELLKRLELGETIFEIPAYVLLSGSDLKMSRFSSSLYYTGYPRTVTSNEVRRVIEQTRSVAALPMEDWILQVVPESFWVNDLTGIQDPVGLEAHRLAVTLQIYTAGYARLRNIARVFETFEFNLKGYFPKPLFLPEGVLNSTDRENDALIIDLSDETTHLVLTSEGRILQTKSLDFGSRLLTSRIAETWQLSQRDAQKLKERFGSLEVPPQFGEELIPLVEREGGENGQIRRSQFHEKFLCFGEELGAKIEQEAKFLLQAEKRGFPSLILTGGGARLEGLLEFLGRKLSSSVRLGTPRPVETSVEILMDPAWAGSLGFIRWICEKSRDENVGLAKENPFGRAFLQAKEWFAAYF